MTQKITKKADKSQKTAPSRAFQRHTSDVCMKKGESASSLLYRRYFPNRF